MAAHYGTAIVPTRVRRPRDKAKVEVAVQVVERWVLARLRHRRFFSLGELNAAIRELTDELNGRTMRRIGCSRRALFETIERSALLALPSEPFEYAEWKRCRPGLDYHIEVHGHWYSVPYRLIRELVEHASPIAQWRYSITVSGSRCMFAAHYRIGTPPSPITCRARIGATPTGPRAGCDARLLRSARQPPPW
jgi:transposase